MRTLYYSTDLCVVGGGLAGVCTAIAAARTGIQVVLLQDRPVLGGNSSGEIRMWVCGARGKDNRATGIIEEIQLENYYQNTGLKFSIWESVLYEKVMLEPNIKLLLNTSCFDAKMNENTIESVKAWQSNAETFHVVKARYFADCSGDSILAPLSGARFMYGREGKSDFSETIAPDIADKMTMGMSCLFQIRETDHEVSFTPPTWAYKFETDADLPYKEHVRESNFWWIELGGEWDCIHDTDKCRDELLKIAYGVWDHMKNYGDHDVKNWELEWIGFLPGKRESRRYVGNYIVNQNDVEAEGRFDDIVAYAGWPMDDHFPQGFYYKDGCSTIFHPAPQRWGIPWRSLYSVNIRNLVFAGRNISVTHAALSSTRVMATCGIIGQAVGTAVAIAVQEKTSLDKLNVERLQQKLMQDDCYIPWKTRVVPTLTQTAQCNTDIIRNGSERGENNCWIGKAGEFIEYNFSQPTQVNAIRLIFDSQLNRDYLNMPCNYKLHETKYKLPETIIKHYRIEGTDQDGRKFIIENNINHQRFVCHHVNWTVVSLKLIPLETWGEKLFRIFEFEIS